MTDAVHNKLPARARLTTLARRGTRIAGYLPVGELPRIAALCRSPTARVFAALQFAFEDASARLVMQIHVRAELRLTCQRCLSAMPWRVDHRNRVVVAGDYEQARRLPRATDHVVCASQDVAPGDVVEEEILLLLPQIPVHDNVEQCDSGVIAHLRAGDAHRVPDEARRNPFAVLKDIRL